MGRIGRGPLISKKPEKDPRDSGGNAGLDHFPLNELRSAGRDSGQQNSIVAGKNTRSYGRGGTGTKLKARRGCTEGQAQKPSGQTQAA